MVRWKDTPGGSALGHLAGCWTSGLGGVAHCV